MTDNGSSVDCGPLPQGGSCRLLASYSIGRWLRRGTLALLGLGAACGGLAGTRQHDAGDARAISADGYGDVEDDGARPGDRADVQADAGPVDGMFIGDGNSAADSEPTSSFEPPTPSALIECFGLQAAGCTRGALESTIGQYQPSPYGQGPRFGSGFQSLVTVRPESGPVSLSSGTFYFWARHFDPFATGETHALAQVAAVDASGAVDENNRAHILFRDGKLEGMVANDTLQTTVLATAESSRHDAMQPGEWHQYAFVWDESAQRLYIDGALVAHLNRTTGGMNATFARVYVGARFSGDYVADSQIAGLAVWDRRLTHVEILWRYKREILAPTLPIMASVSGDDRIASNFLTIAAGTTLPELNFHFVPQVSIEAGGRLIVAFPWFFGGAFPNDPPGTPTAVLPGNAVGTAQCYRQPRLPQTDRCELDLTSGSITAGDEVVLRLSDVAIAGSTATTLVGSSNLNPQFFVDRGGTTTEAGALIQVSERARIAVVDSIPAPHAAVFARLPSSAIVGQHFSLRLWSENADGAPELGATFAVTFTGPAELSGLPASAVITTGTDGGARIDDLWFTAIPAQNPVLIQGTSDTVLLNINPVEVIGDSALRLYWGDIHGHTSSSDGTVAPAEFYPFAQSRGLDFSAMTDHDCLGEYYAPPLEINAVDPATWQLARSLASQYYQPGTFVTFSALEICAGYSVDPAGEGDWNVYFSRDDAPLIATDSILAAGGFLERLATLDPQAIMVPHWGGRHAKILEMTSAQNVQVPVVEIISNHTSAPDGASSWATEFLTAKPELRLGFIGSSDDHGGHPGRSMFWTRQGNIAAWASQLTREGVLDAIRRRHTYAYSHEDRPILHATGNNNVMMGDSVTLGSGENPTLSLSGNSRRRATSVELYKDGTLWWSTTPVVSGVGLLNFSVNVSDDGMTGTSSYYWRVLFDNGATAAWTSPIWFSR